jgi:hypothetical protein
MSNTTLEHTAKTQTDAITKSGKAAIAGFQELAKAYQHLAIKNSDRLSSSMQALATVKTSTEFVELQTRLIREGVEAAVSDGAHIRKLTAAVFTTAFEPVREQIELLRKPLSS